MSAESPKAHDAAWCANVRFLGSGQKREEIKPGIAKGLWHKFFECLLALRRPGKKRLFCQVRYYQNGELKCGVDHYQVWSSSLTT